MPVDKNSHVDTNGSGVGNIFLRAASLSCSSLHFYLETSLYRRRSFSLVQNITGLIKDNNNNRLKAELNFS